MVKFPDHFLWGAATSSYQVEGNNTNADWWPWEKKCGHQQSGEACRHYEYFQQDFDLAQQLGHNAHRFSIEWSRVEPRQGEFDEREIQHYAAVVRALKERGIEPLVTLHHFTNPIWLAARGGWENPAAAGFFVRYVKVMARALGDGVLYWNTINEPTIYASHGYLFGWWPPQKKSLTALMRVYHHMAAAHVQAYGAIKAVYRQQAWPVPQIGVAHHLLNIFPCRNTLLNRLAARWRNQWINFDFLDRINAPATMDFIGLNYYSRQLVDVRGFSLRHLLTDVCRDNHFPVRKNSLGWDIDPRGIYHVLLSLRRYGKPVIITENGICTDDDDQRWDFIRDHLLMVREAMREGVDVRGYMHWSLLDNFEWDKGYRPRFGLVHVEEGTFKRTLKPSAQKYARICKTGEVL